MNKYELLIIGLSVVLIMACYIDKRLHSRKLEKKHELIHNRYWNVSEMNKQINPEYAMEE